MPRYEHISAFLPANESRQELEYNMAGPITAVDIVKAYMALATSENVPQKVTTLKEFVAALGHPGYEFFRISLRLGEFRGDPTQQRLEGKFIFKPLHLDYATEALGKEADVPISGEVLLSTPEGIQLKWTLGGDWEVPSDFPEITNLEFMRPFIQLDNNLPSDEFDVHKPIAASLGYKAMGWGGKTPCPRAKAFLTAMWKLKEADALQAVSDAQEGLEKVRRQQGLLAELGI